MKPKQDGYLSPRWLMAAMLLGALMFSAAAIAQTNSAPPDSRNSFPVLPLEQSASRGIVTRDPSSIVKCKDEYWVFYTGRGVPSYHSKDLVKWERGRPCSKRHRNGLLEPFLKTATCPVGRPTS
ncbi:MAG: hypothetical protein WDM80_16805 [Limisphaerales bacterium]